jgi:Protein of unknown function (DUF4239)
MTLYWIYDLPLLVFGLGTVGLFILFGILGLIFTRKIVATVMGPPPAANDVVSYYFSAIGVFYGLTVGLIAVATWQAYSDADKAVGAEAAALAALYRDVCQYPGNTREELKNDLRDYTQYVIEEAWPIQQRGEIPKGGTDRMTTFQNHLYQFEPTTPGHQILHAEAVRAYNRVIELRRARLQAVTSGLPAALWLVVLVGSALTGSTGYWFHLPSLKVHIVLTIWMSALMGLLVFLIAAMDNPFRGEVSIGPDAFKLIYDGLMKD